MPTAARAVASPSTVKSLIMMRSSSEVGTTWVSDDVHLRPASASTRDLRRVRTRGRAGTRSRPRARPARRSGRRPSRAARRRRCWLAPARAACSASSASADRALMARPPSTTSPATTISTRTSPMTKTDAVTGVVAAPAAAGSRCHRAERYRSSGAELRRGDRGRARAARSRRGSRTRPRQTTVTVRIPPATKGPSRRPARTSACRGPWRPRPPAPRSWASAAVAGERRRSDGLAGGGLRLPLGRDVPAERDDEHEEQHEQRDEHDDLDRHAALVARRRADVSSARAHWSGLNFSTGPSTWAWTRGRPAGDDLHRPAGDRGADRVGVDEPTTVTRRRRTSPARSASAYVHAARLARAASAAGVPPSTRATRAASRAVAPAISWPYQVSANCTTRNVMSMSSGV